MPGDVWNSTGHQWIPFDFRLLYFPFSRERANNCHKFGISLRFKPKKEALAQPTGNVSMRWSTKNSIEGQSMFAHCNRGEGSTESRGKAIKCFSLARSSGRWHAVEDDKSILVVVAAREIVIRNLLQAESVETFTDGIQDSNSSWHSCSAELRVEFKTEKAAAAASHKTKCNICILPINHCKLNEILLFARGPRWTLLGIKLHIEFFEIVVGPCLVSDVHSHLLVQHVQCYTRVFNLNLISFPSSTHRKQTAIR